MNEQPSSKDRVSDYYLESTLRSISQAAALDSQLISTSFLRMLCSELVERRAGETLKSDAAERDDMENIGRALMDTIARNMPGYSWNDCPSEVVVDLINQRDEARASQPPSDSNFQKVVYESAIIGLSNIIGVALKHIDMPALQGYHQEDFALLAPFLKHIPAPTKEVGP